MAPGLKRKEVTMDNKNKIAQFLLQHQQLDGHIRHGAQLEAAAAAAAAFGLSSKTIKNIWSQVKQLQCSGILVHFESKKKGIKHRDKRVFDAEKLRNLSVLERSTIRKMAPKLEVSMSLVGLWVKQKLIRPHTNAIKPALTVHNKFARLKFALSQLKIDIEQGEDIKFQTMKNVIHIDEKWFYMTKTTDRYYLLPDEVEPYRSCQSKRFITKIMFMCAVGRPQFESDGTCIFYGKFGIFPFTTLVPAKRNSKNREKGTLETKPIQSITKEIIKECILNQVISAIKSKWPAAFSKDIIIQQDNARPHISSEDENFKQAANSDGFSMKLLCQPPNSPDCNVNDLGFFRAMQSVQDDKPARNVDDLLKNVVTSFEELSANTLNNVWLTLQGCYREMMKVRGDNDYKIPHMNKARLQRLGLLPKCLTVEEGLVKDCLDYVLRSQNDSGSSYEVGPLMTSFGVARIQLGMQQFTL